jgi:hypothetical protein
LIHLTGSIGGIGIANRRPNDRNGGVTTATDKRDNGTAAQAANDIA